MEHPGHTAVGAWSGGLTMRFGEAVAEDRLVELLRPDGVRAVLTADVYGEGAADRLVGRALGGLERDSYFLCGAVGHDFYVGERQGPKGFPRFTDPALRGPEEYAGYLRMATELSLERCGVERFDLLLLHNPDRVGYESEAVWDGMRALRDEGLTRLIGVAPGPANGFTLDLIGCLERYGGEIDWAMIILNPLEPWPGALVLPAAAASGVRVITRVVDYGGLFHDGLIPSTQLAAADHRAFRPDGWVERGLARMEGMRPIAARHGLTMLQLACQWNLAHEAVECVAPTLIQEAGPDARPIEQQRRELEEVPAKVLLSPQEVREIRRLGDNTGSMALKGASPGFEGEPQPDRWPLTPALERVAARWRIEPQRDLTQAA